MFAFIEILDLDSVFRMNIICQLCGEASVSEHMTVRSGIEFRMILIRLIKILRMPYGFAGCFIDFIYLIGVSARDQIFNFIIHPLLHIHRIRQCQGLFSVFYFALFEIKAAFSKFEFENRSSE